MPAHLFFRHLFWLVLICRGVCAVGTAAAADLQLLPASAHDLEVTAIEGGWQLRTAGADPYVLSELSSAPGAEDHVLEFEYVCAVPIKQPVVYYGPPITAKSYIELPTIPQAEGWHRYVADLSDHLGGDLPQTVRLIRLDFGSQPGITVRLRGLQLRPLQPRERKTKAEAVARELAKQLMEKRIKDYLARPFLQSIDEVRIREKTIVVEAAWTRDSPPKLVEYPVSRSIGDNEPGLLIESCEITTSPGRVRIELPRYERQRDRLHSGFAFVESDQPQRLLSPRAFATQFEQPANAISAPPKPRNQKGLSGLSRRGPESDLPELGISAVTINLVLDRFISETDALGHERIPVDGPPVFFDPSAFVAMDDLIGMARKYDLVVSAIVLIPNHDAFEPTSPLIHPEISGGVYAMPDLTTERGTGVYAFVLDRIAERYKDPTSERGGITNWIAHNEIDFHHVWTNFGRQPRTVATETYYRSMRIIHNAARAYQPRARVFASLTHHWVVADDGLGRQLAPREVIETLQRFSRLEGDFAWGVAYHPYPESLFATVAWDDPSPSDSFDTPLITIQNLPVLGRFLDQPSMRDKAGNVRPVLLSEQGFHTADISEKSQRLQAESLRYAMEQVSQMPIVETFHYHRWLDHPDEGGLNLGLRTIPTATNPFGTKKQAWDVYRALGNP